MGQSWLAALMLAACFGALCHTDCYAPAGTQHARVAVADRIDHVGQHLDPAEPCDGHHVVDSCLDVSRQNLAVSLPAAHCDYDLPAPPTISPAPSLHEPTWPTDTGRALSIVPDRAPPEA